MPFEPRPLGRTGILTGALGLSASYGAPAESVEFAFDHGINYMYWGSRRTGAFADGLRRLAPKRDRYALVIQTYSPSAWLIPGSLDKALRRIGTDYADVLLLGMWNRPVPDRILDVCRQLRRQGKIRHIAVSTHNRKLVPQMAALPELDIFHVRYNAKHTGAEREIFPLLPGENRPGIVSFTATSWKQLLNPKKVPPGDRTPTAGDCYRFVLSNPSVDVCMTGPGNMDHVRELAGALERGPMSREELVWIRRVGGYMYGGGSGH